MSGQKDLQPLEIIFQTTLNIGFIIKIKIGEKNKQKNKKFNMRINDATSNLLGSDKIIHAILRI